MKVLGVALCIGACITIYGCVCIMAGVNHDISTLVLAALTGVLTGVLGYYSGKRR